MKLPRLLTVQGMLPRCGALGPLPSEGAVYRTAIDIALPAVIDTTLIGLVGLVDTMMVGVLGKEAIAAVGLTTQPKYLMMSFFMALSVGVTAVVARRRGQEDAEGARDTLAQAFLVSVLLAAVISLLARTFAREFVLVAGAMPDTVADASAYMRVLAVGMPFASVCLIMNSAQRGIGNTHIAMKVNLTANVVNLCLNYLLIGGNLGFPKLGVRGAAIATTIGYIIGFMLAWRSLCDTQSFLFLDLKRSLPRRRILAPLFKVSVSAFAEQLCMRIGLFWYFRAVAVMGTMVMSVHTIYINIASFIFETSHGLGNAAAAMVGRALGEKRGDLAAVYGNICQRFCLLFIAVISCILGFWGMDIVRLFNADPEVLALSARLMPILIVVVFPQSMQPVYLNNLRGAGDTLYTAIISAMGILCARPLLTWLLGIYFGMGLVGAWLAYLGDQTMRSSLAFLRFRKGHWMRIKV